MYGAPGDYRLQLESAEVPTILQDAGVQTFFIEQELVITTILSAVAFIVLAVWAWWRRDQFWQA